MARQALITVNVAQREQALGVRPGTTLLKPSL
jgi:hypothetical protein